MLPDRSLLREQKLVENAKFKNSNATIWVIFKHCAQALIRRPTRLIGPCFTWPKIQMCSREFKENWIRWHQLREQKCEKWMTDETRLIPKPHCMKSNVKGTFYPWQCFITLIGNAQLWFTSWQFCTIDALLQLRYSRILTRFFYSVVECGVNYIIPANTLVVPLIGHIMNDPSHFPVPEKFDPERYLTRSPDGSGKLTFTPHVRVIPFGIGKRRCLGEVLARTSLYKFFTAIVQKFDIIKAAEEPLLDQADNGFTKAPVPYKIIFKLRTC